MLTLLDLFILRRLGYSAIQRSVSSVGVDLENVSCSDSRPCRTEGMTRSTDESDDVLKS